jgi:MoaA/NifB/PqqE/SkfB family radical SAM enzyme
MEKIFKNYKNNLDYHFSEALDYPFAKPKWVFISLSHKCTYKCKMCEVVKILKDHELPTAKVKQALDSIAAWGNGATVTITGGEAFLRKDIFEIFEYAVARKVNIEVVSNGACIDQPAAQRIVRSGISNIAVSLDGANAEIHDQIRQQGSFQKATQALQFLSAAKKDYGQGPQISVWTTIMKENVSQLFQMINLVKSLGVECLVYHPIIVAQDDMQNTCSGSDFWLNDPQSLNCFKEQIDRIASYQKENGLVAFLHDPYLWLNYFQEDLSKKQWKCNPFVFINIGPDAQVRSCGAAFGSINEMSLDQCLHTAEAKKARILMKQCQKPCLQTCWAHPESDCLENIAADFASEIHQDKSMDKGQKNEALKQGLQALDDYQAIVKKQILSKAVK